MSIVKALFQPHKVSLDWIRGFMLHTDWRTYSCNSWVLLRVCTYMCVCVCVCEGIEEGESPRGYPIETGHTAACCYTTQQKKGNDIKWTRGFKVRNCIHNPGFSSKNKPLLYGDGGASQDRTDNTNIVHTPLSTSTAITQDQRLQKVRAPGTRIHS